jgi:hypothetical protein
MTDFVTPAGLEIKTVEQINNELGAQQKAEIDATLNTAADSPIGQLNGIFASQLREVWEVAKVAYDGFNPDAAEGFLLEKLSALTGTNKRPASKSTVELDCDLDISTVLLKDTHFANVTGDPDNRWTPTNDFTAPSNGVHQVQFRAEFAGAVTANAATITEINTAVSGWNSVTNVDDATVGIEADTDPILRQRREDELRATGSATVDAIRADILVDDDVLQCNVFENDSDTVDASGLPPKSFEVIVFDGTPPVLTNDQIAQLIWDTKPAGMQPFGLESGVATDSIGFFHTIFFSRPTEREIYLEIDLDINISSGYAGAAAMKDAVVLLNSTKLLVGRDVIANDITAVGQGFSGIIDVTAVRLGFSASPVGLVNLVIGPRELARLDTGRIVITENFIPLP